jgi:hypothetical protein
MGRTEFADRLRPSLGSIVLAFVPPPYKGNGGGLAGRDFAEKLCPVNKCQTIWVCVGRVARPGMSQLVNKINQRVRQPFMFHYAFFVG